MKQKGLMSLIDKTPSPKLTVESFRQFVNEISKPQPTKPTKHVANKFLFEQLDDIQFMAMMSLRNTQWLCGEETYNYIETRMSQINNSSK